MTDWSVIFKIMTTAKPRRRKPVAAKSASGRSAASKAGRDVHTDRQDVQAREPRAERAAERRTAIIAAGLDEFTTRGFAATRLDDVAKRAGVAKGTIYLHFKDKEALFQELVSTALVPLIGNLMAAPAAGGSARDVLERFAETFVRDVARDQARRHRSLDHGGGSRAFRRSPTSTIAKSFRAASRACAS